MDNEIRALRQALQRDGDASNTTDKFQDDLLQAVADAAPHGDCVIEVGCFRGGMSAQLEVVGQRLGLQLHVIDVDERYLRHAKHVTERHSGRTSAQFHLCDFATFVRSKLNGAKPALVFVDGDHRYAGVRADIAALFAIRPLPRLAAFHDYSLRYATADHADVRVDKALHDAFGDDFPHRGIGTLAAPGGPLRTEAGADGHFHEVGRYEGVLIDCAELPAPRPL